MSQQFIAVTIALFMLGCTGSTPAEDPIEESWSVTAWGAIYEVFPEVAGLVAGVPSSAHTHVTRLEDFAPLTEGEVSIVLTGAAGEQLFTATEPVRPGIFNVELTPSSAGEYDLLLRIVSSAGVEELRGGRVSVAQVKAPENRTLLVAPAPKAGRDVSEPITFLKEEQWRSDFGTLWVRSGKLNRSLSGLAHVKPPAGGEATITATVDGLLRGADEALSWPYPGQRVARGATLFRIVPRVAQGLSLSSLEADRSATAVELETASARLKRLEELLSLQATSEREVGEARALVATLEARNEAAGRDFEAATSSRQGGIAGSIELLAPITGQIATVLVSPGETVSAGAPLARLVRTDRYWIELEISPDNGRQLEDARLAGLLLVFPQGPPTRIEQVRLVSIAPQVDARTGLLDVLLEVPGQPRLTLGTTAQAEILLEESQEGIVVPASAIIDDGGISVVYLQLSGESFSRQEVQVLERQGDLVLVDHLVPGQRLVSRGGEAIRRSSLMASGEAHGHVH